MRAVSDTVADLHDDLDSGSGVFGPAARRAITAVVTVPRFAGTVITARTAQRLLANEDAMIYDNPHAFLLCHYKREQALCHRDGHRHGVRADVRAGVKDTPAWTTASPAAATASAPTSTPPNSATELTSATNAHAKRHNPSQSGYASTPAGSVTTPTPTTGPGPH